MKMNELREDTLIIDWLGNINASKNTEHSYLLAIQSFTDWVEKKPEELVTETEEEESKAGLKKRLRSIRKYFIGFRKYLQDKGLAPLTVKTYISDIKSFYRTFDIEIPMLPRSGNKAVPLEENKDIPSKEDLQHVLRNDENIISIFLSPILSLMVIWGGWNYRAILKVKT